MSGVPLYRALSLLFFCLVLNPLLAWYMYCSHDMSKSGICFLFFLYQIVIFTLKYRGKQTSIFALSKNKYFTQPPYF